MRKKRNKILGIFILPFLLIFLMLDSTEAVWADSNLSIATYGMTPIYGDALKDGSYSIEVESSSPYFKIEDCQLTVKDGKMQASLTISSKSYLYIYPGTKEEAQKASESDYIAPENEDADQYTFTYSVEALNQDLPCAAYSRRRKKWYDRVILFDASSLPEGALSYELPDYNLIDKAITEYNKNNGSDEDSSSVTTTNSDDPAMVKTEAMDVDLDDGEYSIEVSMTGGSGRASITSPTLLIVKNGKAYARIVWSSTYYDYMIAGGEKYTNENDDGGTSTFTIPISAMDEEFPVIGDTTAMGDPVEIDYQLTFYSDTIGSKGLIPQEAAKKVLVVAVIIAVIGGIINYFFKKSRYK